MPLFEVPYEVTGYGFAVVEAECAHHARALVESGDFDMDPEEEGVEIRIGTIIEIKPESPAL